MIRTLIHRKLTNAEQEQGDFREVQGFRIAFNVEAANMYGTDEHFVFFKTQVSAVRFLA